MDQVGQACNRVIDVNTSYPNADTMAIDWYFTEQRNREVDIGDSIHLVLQDAND